MNTKNKVLLSSVIAEALYKSRYELIIEFIKKNFEVILVAPERDNFTKDVFPNLPVKYYEVNFDRTGINFFKDLKTIYHLIKIMKIEKPVLTYAFGGAKAAIYTTIASYFAKIRNNYCMINGLGSIFRGEGVKSTIIRFIMILLFKASLSKSDGVLFQNKDDLEVFIKNKLVNQNKCKIVNGSGVNLEKFKYSIPNTDHLIFLFVGRLLKDKGIYEFVEAAKEIKKEFPSIEFWVVGGFDTNPTAVKEEEVLCWQRNGYIKYFGYQDNVFQYYTKSSVFVLPSYHEGTPRTNLEAMAVGRPIITTDAPGCRETVVNNMNGFLIKVKDSEALAEKMRFFIQNPNKILEMGLASYHIAVEKYDVHKVNKSILDFLLKNEI